MSTILIGEDRCFISRKETIWGLLGVDPEVEDVLSLIEILMDHMTNDQLDAVAGVLRDLSFED